MFLDNKIKLIKRENTVLIIVTVFSILALIAILNSGCSPQERSGVSRLPQSRPASWENNAFSF